MLDLRSLLQFIDMVLTEAIGFSAGVAAERLVR